MSPLSYAGPQEAGMTIQFEWLDAKKAKVSWTPTTSGPDQQYYIEMSDRTAKLGWKSAALPADQWSLIIDDEESDYIFNKYGDQEPFPGWSPYAGNDFVIYAKGVEQSRAVYEIGEPLMVAPTTKQVTFKATLMMKLPAFTDDAQNTYLGGVANTLNVSRSDVSIGNIDEIDGVKIEVDTIAEVKIELADSVESNGGWDSRDPWRTICGGGNFTT